MKNTKQKYHTVGTVPKFHTVGTVPKYHTVGTVPKYHTVGTVQIHFLVYHKSPEGIIYLRCLCLYTDMVHKIYLFIEIYS
jgi:hypothetical protein